MKKYDTKLQFLNTVELLMNKKTIERISVNEIAAASSLTRQTFYIHFIDKYDAVNSIFLNDFKDGIARFASEELSCRGTMIHILSIMKQKKNFYSNAFKSRGQNSLIDFIIHFYFQFHCILHCQLRKVKSLDDSTISLIKFWSYGTAAYIANWVSEGMKVPEEELSIFLQQRIPESIQIDASLLTSKEWYDIQKKLDAIKDYGLTPEFT